VSLPSPLPAPHPWSFPPRPSLVLRRSFFRFIQPLPSLSLPLPIRRQLVAMCSPNLRPLHPPTPQHTPLTFVSALPLSCTPFPAIHPLPCRTHPLLPKPTVFDVRTDEFEVEVEEIYTRLCLLCQSPLSPRQSSAAAQCFINRSNSRYGCIPLRATYEYCIPLKSLAFLLFYTSFILVCSPNETFFETFLSFPLLWNLPSFIMIILCPVFVIK